MRKFLIVGCGGSGGATLRLLIDQLRADLRARGVASLPDAWQFVHVDVPVDPETGPAPLGSIRELGGTYVSFSSPSNTYQATSLNVESQLAQGQERNFAPLLGWAPKNRARANGVPVTSGAGQYRAIGRMLTLPRLKQLRDALEDAQARAVAPGAWGDIPGREQGSDVLIPIVVASMAGGAGASMFLDVCRVLGQLPGINAANIGCFVYTADVFAKLPEMARANIEGNAMGAVSEIVAAVSRLSESVDRQTLEGFGIQLPLGSAPAFGRILPIGSRIGGSGAFFGDGSSVGVYRGVARALAGVMASEAASQQYLDSFLGNPTPLVNSSERFGWRISDSDLPFGSMGFASLSLGRDRYLDYAAQRLSRSAVDHLVTGHEDPTSQLPSVDQLRMLMDNQWGLSLEAVGLPSPGAPTSSWFQTSAYPRSQWEAAARDASAPVLNVLSNSGQAPAGVWLNATLSSTATARVEVIRTLQRSAYSWAEGWASALEDSTKAEFLRVVAAFGLPYGRELMTRIRRHCDTIISEMATAGLSADATDPLAVGGALAQQAQALGKQVVGAEHALGQLLRKELQSSIENRLRREGARIGAEVLRSYASDVLSGLERAANDALRGLEMERSKTASGAGLAQLHSEVYADWPDETDRVPARFDHAQNEVLLTTSEQFPARYRADVAAAGGGAYTKGIGMIRGEVVSGVWETSGTRSVFDVVVQRGHWRAPALARSAVDGQPTPQAKPSYTLACSGSDLIGRAQKRLAAPGDVFAKFAGASIAEYLADPMVPDVDRVGRQQRFVEKFVETLALARPVVGVDAQMVQRLHNGRGVTYLYSFSEMPFDESDPVAGMIRAQLEGSADLDASTLQNYDKSLVNMQRSTGKISVLGSYEKVSPLCYKSLLEPIKQRWASSPRAFQRSLWLWKRTRPLYAALATSSEEAVRLAAGWYLGRLLGLVRQDNPEAPQVCTPQGWLSFGPLLESEESSIREPVDILPSVLMSHAWAIVRCEGDPELTALAPYEALRHIADSSGSNQQPPPVRDLTGTRLLAQAFRGEPLTMSGSLLPADPQSPVLAEVLQSPRAGEATTQQWHPSYPVPMSKAGDGHTSYADPTAQFGPPQSVSNQDGDAAKARFDAVLGWLAEMHEFALSAGFVRQATGAEPHSYVSRADALPGASLFAEIGPLAVEAFDLISEMAHEALALSRTELSSSKQEGPSFV